MIIRYAQPVTDREQLLKGVRDFISRMDFTPFLPEDDAEFDEHILTLMSRENFDVIVADDEGELVAGIGIVYSQLLWNPGVLHAEEVFWWAAQDAPQTAAARVLKAALGMIKEIEHPRRLVSFKALTTSPESVQRLYGKMGLREVETSYMGVI